MTAVYAPVSAPPSRVAPGDVRQLEHWRLAIERLADPDAMAAPDVWAGLEHYMGQSLRVALVDAVKRLLDASTVLRSRLRTVATPDDAASWRRDLIALRRAYFRTEAMVDFFADALATRTSPHIGALLRACDHIATRSMAEALVPLGRQVPAAMTFLQKGSGAAILRAGIVLGDGLTSNPVAAIKITRHNLLRCTALIHEAGHMVAAMLGWNEELASSLASLPFADRAMAQVWAGWASEIAADAFALAHTGFASVLALRDVVDGDDAAAFQFLPGDPHPIPALRVALSVAALRRAYGAGPWDALLDEWNVTHPISAAPSDVRTLIQASQPMMAALASAMLWKPYRAFGGQPLSRLIDPDRVSLSALEELRRRSGGALYTSPYWLWNEAIRLLALTGFEASGGPDETRAAMARQEEWMLRLGAARSVA
jgi:hypothetical protein